MFNVPTFRLPRIMFNARIILKSAIHPTYQQDNIGNVWMITPFENIVFFWIEKNIFLIDFLKLKNPCLFGEVNPQGVGVVTEDGAGAAHMDGLHTSVNAARAVQRMVVSAALGLSVPPELDVSPGHVIAPASAPGVLDEPVVALGGVSPVTNQQHRVVDNNVLVIITAVKHTFKWRLENI